MSNRNNLGRFQKKGLEAREVRSIRATDSYWEQMGEIAEKKDITRADLLEQMLDEIEKEEYPIIEQINKTIEDKIKEIIEGLGRGGANQLDIPSKEKAIARRTLEAILSYLE